MGSHLHTFIGPLDEKNSIINKDLDDHRKMDRNIVRIISEHELERLRIVSDVHKS